MPRIEEIDGLRAIAILLVVAFCWLSFEFFERRLIGFAHRWFVYLKRCREFGAAQPAGMSALPPPRSGTRC
jgi:peptidoglycan/LPS O-acetylase OafA/YrhL